MAHILIQFQDNSLKQDYNNCWCTATDQKLEDKNTNIYNSIKCSLPVSGQPSNVFIKSEKELCGGISDATDDCYSTIEVDSVGEENEKLFIEKDDELENLISSLAEIPQSYCSEEDKGEDEKIGESFHDQKNDYEDLWENICGLDQVKETILSTVIYPSIFPQFFPRKIRWNQILLYGPPGTGKTMLAKAIASKLNASCFRITSADLLSHWQGESEKQIRNLFETVRFIDSPTILFFDEIDGLCRRRTKVEDDSVRRIKTELLTQLDDFLNSDNTQTYVIGATNCPWEIDIAFMRRFHKKIFVPLPDARARLEILKKNFENIETDLTEMQWNEVGRLTEGYSGCDLINVIMSSCCERFFQLKKCKYWDNKGSCTAPTASFQLLREVLLHKSNIYGDIWVPASSGSLFYQEINFEDIPVNKIGSRNIIFSDIEAAVENTPKTVSIEEMNKYLEYLRNTNKT